MGDSFMDHSEIRRLLQQITSEYEAAQRALYAPTLGTARHSFINERLERMATYHEQLSDGVGQDEAARLLCEEIVAH
jgi:hypothetical protein